MCALAAVLAGVACDRATYRETSDETLVVSLNASQANAGKTGNAYISPQGDATVVRIVVSGISAPVTLPVRLFMFVYEGSCDRLAAEPTYRLTNNVRPESPFNASDLQPGRGPYTLTNTVPASLDALRASAHAIVVRSAASDGDIVLFCGNL